MHLNSLVINHLNKCKDWNFDPFLTDDSYIGTESHRTGGCRIWKLEKQGKCTRQENAQSFVNDKPKNVGFTVFWWARLRVIDVCIASVTNWFLSTLLDVASDVCWWLIVPAISLAFRFFFFYLHVAIAGAAAAPTGSKTKIVDAHKTLISSVIFLGESQRKQVTAYSQSLAIPLFTICVWL